MRCKQQHREITHAPFQAGRIQPTRVHGKPDSIRETPFLRWWRQHLPYVELGVALDCFRAAEGHS